MFTSGSDLPVGVVRAMQHWDARRAAREKEDQLKQALPPPTIALSREVGAGGTSIAQELGRRLGWAVYDHELVERIAKEMNLRSSLLDSVDERTVSWLEECIESFSSNPPVSEESYVSHLVKTLVSLAGHGECIIVGRGAAQLLPVPTTLRVLVVATREDRIARIQQRLGGTPEQGGRIVDETDRMRRRFVQDHFLRDPDDPKNYDLVVNNSRFSVPECTDLIELALRQLKEHLDQKNHPASAG